jgi:hypothetical protein
MRCTSVYGRVASRYTKVVSYLRALPRSANHPAASIDHVPHKRLDRPRPRRSSACVHVRPCSTLDAASTASYCLLYRVYNTHSLFADSVCFVHSPPAILRCNSRLHDRDSVVLAHFRDPHAAKSWFANSCPNHSHHTSFLPPAS